MIVLTRYITESGSLDTELYKLEHNITDIKQLAVFNKVVVPYYNDAIMILRGLTDFNPVELNAMTLHTGKYNIKLSNAGFNFTTLAEPAYGSERECIERNYTITAQRECQKVFSYFDSIRVTLSAIEDEPDDFKIAFTEIRSSGVHTYVYNIRFIYDSQKPADCYSCGAGMLHIKRELARMQDQLYIVDDNSITAVGPVISDLQVSNKDVLRDSIKLLLKNAFNDAMVSDIEITDYILQEETEDEESTEFSSQAHVDLL